MNTPGSKSQKVCFPIFKTAEYFTGVISLTSRYFISFLLFTKLPENSYFFFCIEHILRLYLVDKMYYSIPDMSKHPYIDGEKRVNADRAISYLRRLSFVYKEWNCVVQIARLCALVHGRCTSNFLEIIACGCQINEPKADRSLHRKWNKKYFFSQIRDIIV